MPAKSKAQKRLMSMALAYKKGDLKISDVQKYNRDKIKSLAKRMSDKELEDFTKTPDKNLPEKVKEDLNLNNINGMGDIILPDGELEGSGDIPFPLKWDEIEETLIYKKKQNDEYIKL